KLSEKERQIMKKWKNFMAAALIIVMTAVLDRFL
ncbi:hypothetical protein C818_02610, partial [Lachnospiraceae bacterium MD308]